MVGKQLPLVFQRRGGKRKGAGRPPNGARAMVSHSQRPQFEKATPAHVTLRIASDIPSLRSSRRFAAIKACFANGQKTKPGLRLVEFTVLSNHLHLIVEADSSRGLSRGMQGLCVRLARALNLALKRSGRVFADHFHSELLQSPTRLVNALRYVLDNARHHYGEPGADSFSSEAPGAEELLAERRSWLLRSGWLKAPGHLLTRLLQVPRYARVRDDRARDSYS